MMFNVSFSRVMSAVVTRVVTCAAIAVLAAGATLARAELQVSGAWVRAMPPGQRMTAAYLRLKNTGAEAIQITGVSSERGNASLHETRTVEGRSSMRAVDELQLPVSGTLDFRPGGLHIMIMGLQSTPREGDSLRICLQTSAGDTCFPAEVRRGAPQAASQHSHAEH